MGYSPTLGRWLEQDPLGTQNQRGSALTMLITESGLTIGGAQLQYVDGMNLYQYIKSNPRNHVDPSGLQVDLWFNRKTGELYARDRDTGAEARVAAGCAFSGDDKDAPIPLGNFDILERKNRDGWYRLDPIDTVPRNDRVDDGEGEGRSFFRLHPGRRSDGCITVRDGKPDCKKQWDAFRNLLDGTKKVTARDAADNNAAIPKFGNLIVYDDPATTKPTTKPTTRPTTRPGGAGGGNGCGCE